MLFVPLAIEISPKTDQYSIGILIIGGQKKAGSLFSYGIVDGEPMRELFFSELWLPALKELIQKLRK